MTSSWFFLSTLIYIKVNWAGRVETENHDLLQIVPNTGSRNKFRTAGSGTHSSGSSHVTYETSSTLYSLLRRFGVFIDASLVTKTSINIYIPKGWETLQRFMNFAAKAPVGLSAKWRTLSTRLVPRFFNEIYWATHQNGCLINRNTETVGTAANLIENCGFSIPLCVEWYILLVRR